MPVRPGRGRAPSRPVRLGRARLGDAPGPGEHAGQSVAHDEDDRAAHPVEEVVVGGDDHHGDGGHRVGDGQGLGPPGLHPGQEDPAAPQGPPAVQAGHGRVLVGDRLHGRRVERPEGRVLHQRVHVAEGGVVAEAVEQPGGHEREGGEPDEAQHGAHGQRVAHQRVAVGESPVQPDQRADGDGQVDGAVVVVGRDDRPLGVSQGEDLPVVLVVDVEGPLPADEAHGVVEGVGGAGRVEVAQALVDEVEHHDDADLDPPVDLVAGAQPGAAAPTGGVVLDRVAQAVVGVFVEHRRARIGHRDILRGGWRVPTAPGGPGRLADQPLRRISPSCTTVTARCPSWVKIEPRAMPRAPDADGLTWS